MFFHYSQNNSGGSFTGDYHHVIIEAICAEVADVIAESQTDIYFDGCSKEIDCDCCGDRWSRTWSDGVDEPMIFGSPAKDYSDTMFGGGVLILYADGTRWEKKDPPPLS